LRADPIGRGLRQEKAGLHLSYLPQLQTNAAELCKLGERACRKAGPQGPEGPAFAPRNFLAAVPDIRVELEKVIFAGNYVTVHMKFSGRLPPYSARRDGKVNRSPSSPPIWPWSMVVVTRISAFAGVGSGGRRLSMSSKLDAD
jgi:hypothetical protein